MVEKGKPEVLGARDVEWPRAHRHEEAYYGHLVWRLMGCLVLFYTSRVICKGRMTMEEIIFSPKHYWRFVDIEALELKALSQRVDEKVAWTQAELRDWKGQDHIV
jgi:hypothetical protein